MKTILVTGDWVADWNLARPKDLPEGYFDGSKQSQLHLRNGGGWYVAHLIQNVACRDLSGTVHVDSVRPVSDCAGGLNPDGTQRDDLAHAYSVWWKRKRLESGKDDDQVWRIARFAGCRKATSWQPPAGVRKNANLLVIDDLGLGFSEHSGALPHIKARLAGSGDILLKHGVRPDGTGMLPLLLKAGLAARLHVVVSANALRLRNAGLSRGLSWDRTLEDIEDDLNSGPSAHDLAKCKLVVIHFGLAGAAVFKEGKLHRFY